MAENTKIEWTTHTLNSWWGCTKVSPACDHCYAETFAKRVGFSETGSQFPIWGKDTKRRFFGDKHWDEPLKWDRDAEAAGERPRVFCSSMADVFEDHPDLEFHRKRLWSLIEATNHLDWMLLTKRPQNIRKMLPASWIDSPRKNVWPGTTVESPEYFWRVDELRRVPAVLRFLSVEPLLADVSNIDLTGIGFVIVGGESGPGSRPTAVQWIRGLIKRCDLANVAVFVKQLGAKPINESGPLKLKDRKGGDMSEWPADLQVRELPEVPNHV
jgi:protein gp37